MIPIVFYAIAALALVGSVIAQQDEAGTGRRIVYEPSAAVTVVRDITYARYGDRELPLDLYLPTDRGTEPIPGIVVIRGGGWRRGGKDGFAPVAAALASRGLAAACIEYRTSGEATFPAAVYDTKAAVRWLRAHAPEYGIDPGALGAMGGSAGAHLAAFLATTHRMDELDGEGGNPDVSNRIQAAVAMAAPADLPAMAASAEAPSAVVQFLDVEYEQDPELWTLASPLTHVHSGAAPILLLHSNTDRTVPHHQSEALRQRYEEAGIVAQVVTTDGAPHAFWNWSRWFDDTMDRAAAFFKEHLENR